MVFSRTCKIVAKKNIKLKDYGKVMDFKVVYVLVKEI